MKDVRPTLWNYAELARLSNAPTIITNVLVGCAVAARNGELRWLTALAMIFALLLMYSAGMALNDVLDADVDRAERPGRPIPSGRIPRRHALIAAIAGLAVGIIISGLFSVAALVAAVILAATIVAYDMLHRINVATVGLMGACRALAYIVPALAMNPQVDGLTLAVPAGVMMTYIILVSLIARLETGGALEWRKAMAMIVPLLVLAPAALVWSKRATTTLAAVLLALGGAVWAAMACVRLFQKRPNVVAAVLAWLAGICIVDAFVLAMLDRLALAFVACVCFVVAVLAHRRIHGT